MLLLIVWTVVPVHFATVMSRQAMTQPSNVKKKKSLNRLNKTVNGIKTNFRAFIEIKRPTFLIEGTEIFIHFHLHKQKLNICFVNVL